MNSDIRLSLGFYRNPKTKKLIKRLGLEGIVALQLLWIWCAENRPDGDLSGMDDEDIELAADWNGEESALVETLADLRWIDKTETGYVLHGWAERNPWAAEADNRSDKARLSKLAQVNPDAYHEFIDAGRTGISKEEYQRAANGALPERRNCDATATAERRNCDATATAERRNSDATATATATTATAERPIAKRSAPSPSPSPSPDPDPEVDGEIEILGTDPPPIAPPLTGGGHVAGNPPPVEQSPPPPKTRAAKRKPEPEPEAFTAFWDAYPRKVGKPQALKAWLRIRPDPETVTAISAGLTRWIRVWDRRGEDGRQFIPYPATFLNQERWKETDGGERHNVPNPKQPTFEPARTFPGTAADGTRRLPPSELDWC